MYLLEEELELLYWEDEYKARCQLVELGLEHSQMQHAMQQLYDEPRVNLEACYPQRMSYYNREQEAFYNLSRGDHAERGYDRVQENFPSYPIRDGQTEANCNRILGRGNKERSNYISQMEQRGTTYSRFNRPEDGQWNRIPSSETRHRVPEVNCGGNRVRRHSGQQESSGSFFSRHHFPQPEVNVEEQSIVKECRSYNRTNKSSDIENPCRERNRPGGLTKRAESAHQKACAPYTDHKWPKNYENRKYFADKSEERNRFPSGLKLDIQSKLPVSRTECASQVKSNTVEDRKPKGSSLIQDKNNKLESTSTVVASKTVCEKKQNLRTDKQGQGILQHKKQLIEKCVKNVDKKKTSFWDLVHEMENKHASPSVSKFQEIERHKKEQSTDEEESHYRDDKNDQEAKQHSAVKCMLGEGTKSDFEVKEKKEQQCNSPYKAKSSTEHLNQTLFRPLSVVQEQLGNESATCEGKSSSEQSSRNTIVPFPTEKEQLKENESTTCEGKSSTEQNALQLASAGKQQVEQNESCKFSIESCSENSMQPAEVTRLERNEICESSTEQIYQTSLEKPSAGKDELEHNDSSIKSFTEQSCQNSEKPSAEKELEHNDSSCKSFTEQSCQNLEKPSAEKELEHNDSSIKSSTEQGCQNLEKPSAEKELEHNDSSIKSSTEQGCQNLEKPPAEKELEHNDSSIKSFSEQSCQNLEKPSAEKELEHNDSSIKSFTEQSCQNLEKPSAEKELEHNDSSIKSSTEKGCQNLEKPSAEKELEHYDSSIKSFTEQSSQNLEKPSAKKELEHNDSSIKSFTEQSCRNLEKPSAEKELEHNDSSIKSFTEQSCQNSEKPSAEKELDHNDSSIKSFTEQSCQNSLEKPSAEKEHEHNDSSIKSFTEQSCQNSLEKPFAEKELEHNDSSIKSFTEQSCQNSLEKPSAEKEHEHNDSSCKSLTEESCQYLEKPSAEKELEHNASSCKSLTEERCQNSEKPFAEKELEHNDSSIKSFTEQSCQNLEKPSAEKEHEHNDSSIKSFTEQSCQNSLEKPFAEKELEHNDSSIKSFTEQSCQNSLEKPSAEKEHEHNDSSCKSLTEESCQYLEKPSAEKELEHNASSCKSLTEESCQNSEKPFAEKELEHNDSSIKSFTEQSCQNLEKPSAEKEHEHSDSSIKSFTEQSCQNSLEKPFAEKELEHNDSSIKSFTEQSCQNSEKPSAEKEHEHNDSSCKSLTEESCQYLGKPFAEKELEHNGSSCKSLTEESCQNLEKPSAEKELEHNDSSIKSFTEQSCQNSEKPSAGKELEHNASSCKSFTEQSCQNLEKPSAEKEHEHNDSSCKSLTEESCQNSEKPSAEKELECNDSSSKSSTEQSCQNSEKPSTEKELECNDSSSKSSTEQSCQNSLEKPSAEKELEHNESLSKASIEQSFRNSEKPSAEKELEHNESFIKASIEQSYENLEGKPTADKEEPEHKSLYKSSSCQNSLEKPSTEQCSPKSEKPVAEKEQVKQNEQGVSSAEQHNQNSLESPSDKFSNEVSLESSTVKKDLEQNEQTTCEGKSSAKQYEQHLLEVPPTEKELEQNALSTCEEKSSTEQNTKNSVQSPSSEKEQPLHSVLIRKDEAAGNMNRQDSLHLQPVEKKEQDSQNKSRISEDQASGKTSLQALWKSAFKNVEESKSMKQQYNKSSTLKLLSKNVQMKRQSESQPSRGLQSSEKQTEVFRHKIEDGSESKANSSANLSIKPAYSIAPWVQSKQCKILSGRQCLPREYYVTYSHYKKSEYNTVLDVNKTEGYERNLKAKSSGASVQEFAAVKPVHQHSNGADLKCNDIAFRHFKENNKTVNTTKHYISEINDASAILHHDKEPVENINESSYEGTDIGGVHSSLKLSSSKGLKRAYSLPQCSAKLQNKKKRIDVNCKGSTVCNTGDSLLTHHESKKRKRDESDPFAKLFGNKVTFDSANNKFLANFNESKRICEVDTSVKCNRNSAVLEIGSDTPSHSDERKQRESYGDSIFFKSTGSKNKPNTASDDCLDNYEGRENKSDADPTSVKCNKIGELKHRQDKGENKKGKSAGSDTSVKFSERRDSEDHKSLGSSCENKRRKSAGNDTSLKERRDSADLKSLGGSCKDERRKIAGNDTSTKLTKSREVQDPISKKSSGHSKKSERKVSDGADSSAKTTERKNTSNSVGKSERKESVGDTCVKWTESKEPRHLVSVKHLGHSRENERRKCDEDGNSEKCTGKKAKVDHVAHKVLANSHGGERRKNNGNTLVKSTESSKVQHFITNVHTDHSNGNERRKSDAGEKCTVSSGRKLLDSGIDRILPNSIPDERRKKIGSNLARKSMGSGEAQHCIRDKHSGHPNESERRKSDAGESSEKSLERKTLDSAKALANSNGSERRKGTVGNIFIKSGESREAHHSSSDKHSEHSNGIDKKKGDAVNSSDKTTTRKKALGSVDDTALPNSNRRKSIGGSTTIKSVQSGEGHHPAIEKHSDYSKEDDRRKSDTGDNSKTTGKKALGSAVGKILFNSRGGERRENIEGDTSVKCTENRDAQDPSHCISKENERRKKDGDRKKTLNVASDKVLCSSKEDERMKNTAGNSVKHTAKREAQDSANCKSSDHSNKIKKRKLTGGDNGKKEMLVCVNNDAVNSCKSKSKKGLEGCATLSCTENREPLHGEDKLSAHTDHKARKTGEHNISIKPTVSRQANDKVLANSNDRKRKASSASEGIVSAGDILASTSSKTKKNEGNTSAKSNASEETLTYKTDNVFADSMKAKKRKMSDDKSSGKLIQKKKTCSSTSNSKHINRSVCRKPEGSTSTKNSTVVQQLVHSDEHKSYKKGNSNNFAETDQVHNTAIVQPVVHSDQCEGRKSNAASTSVTFSKRKQVQNSEKEKGKKKQSYKHDSSTLEEKIAQIISVIRADGENKEEEESSHISVSDTDTGSVKQHSFRLFGKEEINRHHNYVVSVGSSNLVTSSTSTEANIDLEQPQFGNESTFDIVLPIVEQHAPAATTSSDECEAVSANNNISTACISDKNVSKEHVTQNRVNLKGKVAENQPDLIDLTEEASDEENDSSESLHEPLVVDLVSSEEEECQDNKELEEYQDKKELEEFQDNKELEECQDNEKVDVVEIGSLSKENIPEKKDNEAHHRDISGTGGTQISRRVLRTKNDSFLDQAHEMNREAGNETIKNTSNAEGDNAVASCGRDMNEMNEEINKNNENITNAVNDSAVANSSKEMEEMNGETKNKNNDSISNVVDDAVPSCSKDMHEVDRGIRNSNNKTIGSTSNVVDDGAIPDGTSSTCAVTCTPSTSSAEESTDSSGARSGTIRCVDIRTLRPDPGFFADADTKFIKATECVFVIVQAFDRHNNRIALASGLSEDRRHREVEQARSDFEASIRNVYEELLELFSNLETTFNETAMTIMTNRLNTMAAPKVYSLSDVKKCIIAARSLYQSRTRNETNTVPQQQHPQNGSNENIISSHNEQNSGLMQSVPSTTSAVNQLVDQPNIIQHGSTQDRASSGITESNLPVIPTQRAEIHNYGVQSGIAQQIELANQRSVTQYLPGPFLQPVNGYNLGIPNVAVQNHILNTQHTAPEVNQPVNHNVISNSLSENQSVPRILSQEQDVAPLVSAVSNHHTMLANENQRLVQHHRYMQTLQNARERSAVQDVRMQRYSQQNNIQASLSLRRLLHNNGQQNLQMPIQEFLPRSVQPRHHPFYTLPANNYQHNVPIAHGQQQRNNYGNINESGVPVSNAMYQLQQQRSNGFTVAPTANFQTRRLIAPSGYSEWLAERQRRAQSQISGSFQNGIQPTVSGNRNRTVTSAAPLSQPSGGAAAGSTNYAQHIMLNAGNNANASTTSMNLAAALMNHSNGGSHRNYTHPVQLNVGNNNGNPSATSITFATNADVTLNNRGNSTMTSAAAMNQPSGGGDGAVAAGAATSTNYAHPVQLNAENNNANPSTSNIAFATNANITLNKKGNSTMTSAAPLRQSSGGDAATATAAAAAAAATVGTGTGSTHYAHHIHLNAGNNVSASTTNMQAAAALTNHSNGGSHRNYAHPVQLNVGNNNGNPSATSITFSTNADVTLNKRGNSTMTSAAAMNQPSGGGDGAVAAGAAAAAAVGTGTGSTHYAHHIHLNAGNNVSASTTNMQAAAALMNHSNGGSHRNAGNSNACASATGMNPTAAVMNQSCGSGNTYYSHPIHLNAGNNNANVSYIISNKKGNSTLTSAVPTNKSDTSGITNYAHPNASTTNINPVARINQSSSGDIANYTHPVQLNPGNNVNASATASATNITPTVAFMNLSRSYTHPTASTTNMNPAAAVNQSNGNGSNTNYAHPVQLNARNNDNASSTNIVFAANINNVALNKKGRVKVTKRRNAVASEQNFVPARSRDISNASYPHVPLYTLQMPTLTTVTQHCRSWHFHRMDRMQAPPGNVSISTLTAPRTGIVSVENILPQTQITRNHQVQPNLTMSVQDTEAARRIVNSNPNITYSHVESTNTETVQKGNKTSSTASQQGNGLTNSRRNSGAENCYRQSSSLNNSSAMASVINGREISPSSSVNYEIWSSLNTAATNNSTTSTTVTSAGPSATTPTLQDTSRNSVTATLINNVHAEVPTPTLQDTSRNSVTATLINNVHAEVPTPTLQDTSRNSVTATLINNVHAEVPTPTLQDTSRNSVTATLINNVHAEVPTPTLQDTSRNSVTATLINNVHAEVPTSEQNSDPGNVLRTCVSSIEGKSSQTNTNSLNKNDKVSAFHTPKTVKETSTLRDVELQRNTGTKHKGNSAQSVPKTSTKDGNGVHLTDESSCNEEVCESSGIPVVEDRSTEVTQRLQAPVMTGRDPPPSTESARSTTANPISSTSTFVQSTQADKSCENVPSPADEEENGAIDNDSHAAQMEPDEHLNEAVMPRTLSRDSGYRTPSPEVIVTDEDEIEMLCSVCGKEARLMCAVCQCRLYCSVVCQAKDWTSHYLYCAYNSDDEK